MAARSMPLNRENLDVTMREHNGATYLTIGEHFMSQENEWRGGTRSISLDVSDPADREVLEGFVALLCDRAGQALETVKPAIKRPASNGRIPSWQKYLNTDPDRQDGPVTIIPAPQQPAPQPQPETETPAPSLTDRAAQQVSGRGRFAR